MADLAHSIPSKYRGLIALNLVAVALLCLVTFAQNASGQPSRTRVAGEYTMVSGNLQGRSEDAVYIIDARNREMLVLVWERTQQKLSPVGGGFRNFDADSGENARNSR